MEVAWKLSRALWRSSCAAATSSSRITSVSTSAEKLGKLERYDDKIIRTDVELQHEKNPRQNGSCQHVEITCRTRGPVVRSEACADDFYKALDLAVDKLERRLRQAADRRRIHHGRRTPPSVAEVTAALPDVLPDDVASARDVTAAQTDGASDGPGRVVREKEHPATPMTVDQALLQMELVGHDFYPVQRLGDRPAERRLPPARLRLRADPARHAA